MSFTAYLEKPEIGKFTSLNLYADNIFTLKEKMKSFQNEGYCLIDIRSLTL